MVADARSDRTARPSQRRRFVQRLVADAAHPSTLGTPDRDTWTVDPRGAYTADRAAALSGVPKSTVHYWARREILVPSISDVRIRLWSYSDLMSLRTIAWLRATKTAPDGQDVPATAMRAVRRALRDLAELDLGLWTEDVDADCRS